jgi:hypothetical protein
MKLSNESIQQFFTMLKRKFRRKAYFRDLTEARLKAMDIAGQHKQTKHD